MLKKVLIFLLFTGYCSFAIGQSLFESLRNQSHVFYMKNSWGIVPDKESADFVRVIITPNIPNPELYRVEDYYMTGKLKLTGWSKTLHAYYTGQGTFIEYFPNGNRKITYTYNNGIRG